MHCTGFTAVGAPPGATIMVGAATARGMPFAAATGAPCFGGSISTGVAPARSRRNSSEQSSLPLMISATERPRARRSRNDCAHADDTAGNVPSLPRWHAMSSFMPVASQ